MRTCPNCGNTEPENSKFCSVCGTSMQSAPRQNPYRQNGAQPRHDQPPVQRDPSTHSKPKKNSSNLVVVLVVVAICVLIVVGCGVFAFRMLFGGSSSTSDKTTTETVSVTHSALFPSESETAQVTESAAVETETTPAESAVISESSSTSPEESESPSPSPSESPSPSPEESESPSPSPSAAPSDAVSKSYDGVTITTDYVIANSNSAYLSESDLSGMNAQQLKIARNEIYARHGRKFNDTALQAYFNSCSWYVGTISPDDFTDSMLNSYELENSKTIRAYESKMGYNQ